MKLAADENRTLYDADFAEWAQKTAEAVRRADFDGIDLDHIAEEIEDLGANDFHAVRSHLTGIMAHMLKWDYQPEKRTRSWIVTIGHHRISINRLFDRSPSLRRRLRGCIDGDYRYALDIAVIETGLASPVFPPTCPYTWDDVFTREFALESDENNER